MAEGRSPLPGDGLVKKSRSARFLQIDATRALKGAVAAGMKPTAMRIGSTGEIIVTFDDEPAEVSNSFDAALGQR